MVGQKQFCGSPSLWCRSESGSYLSFWCRILPFNLMRIRILQLIFPQLFGPSNAPKWPSKALTVSLWRRLGCGYGCFTLMRIRIQLSKMMRVRIHNTVQKRAGGGAVMWIIVEYSWQWQGLPVGWIKDDSLVITRTDPSTKIAFLLLEQA